MDKRLVVISVVLMVTGVIILACKSMEWHSDGYIHVAEPTEAAWVVRTSMPVEVASPPTGVRNDGKARPPVIARPKAEATHTIKDSPTGEGQGGECYGI